MNEVGLADRINFVIGPGTYPLETAFIEVESLADIEITIEHRVLIQPPLHTFLMVAFEIDKGGLFIPFSDDLLMQV